MEELIKYLNEKYGTENSSYTTEELQKYTKIVRKSYGSISSYAFVAKESFNNKQMGDVTIGEIFKASSWKTPARHARALLSDKSTWNKLGAYSPEYLK